ncbi:MAG: hypothetical protein E7E62_02385 [Weissella confusa]|nr:hypothetical protein [Weissella confusa]
MGLALQIGTSIITVLLFVGLAAVAIIMAWPLWVSIPVFLLLFVLMTVVMSWLTVTLRLKAEKKEEEANHD